MCIALGNYHNMDTARTRIASEYVSLRDWERMVDWFEALVLDERGCDQDNRVLREAMDKRFANYESLLAGRPVSTARVVTAPARARRRMAAGRK
jgi:hypothetical protein